MSSTMPSDPQAMGVPELQEYLIALAEAARTAVAADDYSPVQRSRELLGEWLNALTGPRLALVEVGVAFLDNLLGSKLSKRAVAARRFLDACPREAPPFFEELIKGYAVEIATTSRWAAGARLQLEALEQTGVILRDDDAKVYYLAQTAREWLRDMVEPLPFRMWRIVTNARGRAASLADNDARVTVIASLTGVTEHQARAHIARVQFEPSPRSVRTFGPRYVRGKIVERGTLRTEPTAPMHAEVENVARDIRAGGGSIRNDAHTTARAPTIEE